jgi:hypothetical protein
MMTRRFRRAPGKVSTLVPQPSECGQRYPAQQDKKNHQADRNGHPGTAADGEDARSESRGEDAQAFGRFKIIGMNLHPLSPWRTTHLFNYG